MKNSFNIRRFLATVKYQTGKDLVNISKSWYLVGLIIATVVIMFLWFYNLEIYKPIFPPVFSMKTSIITNLVQFIFGIYGSFFAFAIGIFLIVPAIIITDDVETGNFKILRTIDFNVTGYVVSKIISSLLLIFSLILIMSYATEIYLFYNGYMISSGFIIEPIILSGTILVVLLLPISLTLFVSSVLPNKVFSIVIAILLPVVSLLIGNQIQSASGDKFSSLFPVQILHTLAGNALQVNPRVTSDGNVLQIIPHVTSVSFNVLSVAMTNLNIIAIMESVLFLFIFTWISVFLRKYSVIIFRKIHGKRNEGEVEKR